MSFIEKLEKYFNTGSTDKQNKRRLGGLLIAITAMLLAASIVAVAVGGVVVAIIGLIDGAKKPDDNADKGPNTHLAEVALTDVATKADENKLFTLTNMEIELTEADYIKLQRPNRPVANDKKTKLYGCESADNFALQKDAFAAFNAMVTAFYGETNNTKLWVKLAYNVQGGNVSYYANALAVMLDYVTDDEEYTTASIYNVEEYKWIYDNAHEYGFVRVSDTEGEENVFKYVGFANAKYIQNQQRRNKDNFYSIDSYISEIKASTPDDPISISGVKRSLNGEGGKTAYYVYYMPAESASYKLPTDKYDYTVMAIDGGYVVTYCKTATK